jgi:hypothetical protein
MITRTCIILVILLGNIINGYAQGTLRGKVTDENGEPVIGGLVVLKNNKLIASSTDLDGNYSIKLPDSIPQTLVVSYIGYQTIEEVISIKKGEVLIKNFDLKSTSKEIKEVVVEGRANRAKDNYMEKMKINSATTIDFISAETIKKTGDANVAAAVARVSGVATNGAFITVRGIGDRYVKTLINGLVIPTLDPLTNNIKLDLFPASLLDNLFITKTASPELPGDFSGALISLQTKDFPDKLIVNVESSAGYNNQSSFKEVLSSDRSSTEWLGYDSDLRDIDHLAYREVREDISIYDQMSVLGLKDYYASMGIDEKTPFTEDYFKLGLVQLGLLDKGKFDDAEAFMAAKAKFNENNTNRNKAFRAVNEDAAKFGQSIPNNWDVKNRVAPLNFSQSFSIGNQILLFNRPLGILAGLRYSSAVQNDPNAKINRIVAINDGIVNYNLSANQNSTKETNGWSGLMQLSYKVHNNHSFSFMFMPNFIGVNNVRNFLDSANSLYNLVVKDQFYEQRRQLVYQAKSQHYFPKIKSKLEFNGSYSFGKSVAPDFKSLIYTITPFSNINGIGGSDAPIRRFYRYLDEKLLDSKVKMEIPFFEKPDLSRKIKVGSSYLQSNRDTRQYEYFVGGGPFAEEGFANEDVTGFFANDEFGFKTYTNQSGLDELTINKYFRRVALDSYHTIGHNKIYAGFAMVDFAIVSKFRVSGGLRVEKTDTYTDVFKFDSLGYTANDPRRLQREDLYIVNPGFIDQTNLLPSVNLIYKIKNDELAPINLRANYSKTIARPSIRELSETLIFDYEFRTFVFGNSTLKTVDIDNYDLRFESYFKNGDNLSVSLFYKNFVNHIEFVQTTQGFSWQNAGKSNVSGIELDGRKNIIKGLDFRANITFAKSITTVVLNTLLVKEGVKIYEPTDTITRGMAGQAPYVLNGILSYSLDSIGLSFAVSYNVQGPRLSIVSAQPDFIPDVYELPRHLLDFKVSKSIGKYFTVSATVKDVLNSPVRRSYNINDGADVDFDSFRYGTNYILSIAYKL